ncbi:hypothetical protein D3C76_1386700 [compost metagenome]
MVDIHHAPVLAVKPPLVLISQGHLHRALGDPPLLFPIPHILGAVDVDVPLDGVQLERPTLFRCQALYLLQLFDLIEGHQLFVGAINPLLRQRLAHQRFKSGPLHRLRLVEIPHVGRAFHQCEPPQRSFQLQSICPLTP